MFTSVTLPAPRPPLGLPAATAALASISQICHRKTRPLGCSPGANCFGLTGNDSFLALVQNL